MAKACRFLIIICLLSTLTTPALADSPGVTVGHSARDQQTVGATNNRCNLDSQGGAHMSWTAGELPDRNVYYNFVDENGQIRFVNGVDVNAVPGAGYSTVEVNSNDAAVVAYHNFSNMVLTLAVDAGRGMGVFTLYDPPDQYPGQGLTFWPMLAIDSNGNYHIVSVEHGMGDVIMPMYYSRSTNGGIDWEPLSCIDTIIVHSYQVVASKFDSKVAIVYAQPRNIIDPDYYNNDVVYIESPDGINWNFGDKTNITNYSNNDSLRCFNSLDAIYDQDGELHIVWTTPFYEELAHYATSDTCILWHWSESTGITEIADGLNPSNPGAWNHSISSCNLSINDNGDLFVTYCRFGESDTSTAGYSNAEIYYTLSIDGGQFWLPDENLTNSPSPNCQPGECDNDVQPSTAELIDNSFHIFYINDKDAGMSNSGEGEVTDNPQMYLRYQLSVNVDEGGNKYIPGVFYLSPSYPNPFNASTKIGYEIVEAGLVRIEIFNIAGQIVETPVDEIKQPGHYVVNFNAEGLASGIYYAMLTSGEKTFTRKLTLLK